MNDIFIYLLATCIGISLGLIGGGGSILTVPVLVYVVGIAPVMATAYSLFIVGITSLAGVFTYSKKQLISFKTAFVFAVPSFVAVFLVRKFVVPALPDTFFTLSGFVLTKDIALMLLFAILMFFAALSMIGLKKSAPNASEVPKSKEIKFNFPLIFIEGFVVGVLTGLVGAGGGFMIIPALVVLARLPMKLAVGTSLLIIAAKSLIGFLGDVLNLPYIDWALLLGFSSAAIVGIFIGSYLSNFISAKKLKKSFGWFVVVMAIYIFVKELFIQ